MGRFHSFEEAVKARKLAEELLYDNFLHEYFTEQVQSANGAVAAGKRELL